MLGAFVNNTLTFSFTSCLCKPSVEDQLRINIETRASFDSSDAMDKSYRLAAVVISEKKNERSVAFDRLLAFLLANFDGATSVDMLPALPQNQTKPIELSHTAFPVALVSEILTVHKVRIQTQNVKNWPSFAERYGPNLLRSELP